MPEQHSAAAALLEGAPLERALPERGAPGAGGAALPAAIPDGLDDGPLVSFGTLDLRDVLTAAHRRLLHQAGLDLPGEAKWRSAAGPGEPTGDGDRHPGCGIGAAPGDGSWFRPDEPGGGAPADPGGALLTTAEWAGHVMTEPGPGLAGWLTRVPPAELDEAALVTSITGWRKLTSWAQAQELTAVAELARRRGVCGEDPARDGPVQPAQAGIPDQGGTASAADSEGGHEQLRARALRELAAEFAPNEVALALTLTRTGAEYWLDLAVSLASRLPRTLAALAGGVIDLSRARLIDHYTSTLTGELARTVESRVLTQAGRQTSGQLRAALQRAVITADPAAAERRRQQTENSARVELSGDDDGTAALGGRFLPAAQAGAAWARICALAKAMQSAGAAGGADLLRAQVFTGLLLGTLPLIPPASDDAAGPEGRGPEDAGPADGGPADGGPADGGPASSPPTDSGPADSGPAGCGPAGCGPVGSRPAGQHSSPSASRRSPGAAHNGVATLPPWPPIPPPDHRPAPGCAPPWPARPGNPGRRRQPDHERAGPASPAGRAATQEAGSPGAPAPPAGESEPRTPRRDGKAFLTVPWRTLAGLASEPGTLSRIGPVTAAVTRALAAAAAAGTGCAWRVVVTGRSGRALGVATVPRAWLTRSRPPATAASGPATAGMMARVTLTVPLRLLDGGAPDPASWACQPELRPVLAAALRAGTRAAQRARAAASGDGSCSHHDEVPGYRVPESMRALLEARDQTCRFPRCRQPAWHCDQDHTLAYHRGGRTCPCNLSAACRHHHRLKQLAAWQLTQPRPGELTWRTPAGLTYTVRPAAYGY